MPRIGDRVRVCPAPGEAVQRGPGLHGQFLPKEGAEVIWTPYHEQRLADGSIKLPPEHYHQQRLTNRLSFLDGELATCKDEKQQAQFKAEWEQCRGEFEALSKVADQKEGE